MDPWKTLLESLLDQTIDNFKLRNILVKYGIPSDEIVEIELCIENKVIVTCNVPFGDSNASFEGSFSPLPGLRDCMNDFFNNGQEKFELLKQINDPKTTLFSFKSNLNIGAKLSGEMKIPALVLASFHIVFHPCPRTPNDPDSYCTV